MIYKNKLNRKKDQYSKKDGCSKLRVWHRKGKGKHLPVVTVGCGCCNEKVEIFYDHENETPSIEINGVWGSIQMWEEVLLPLLQIEDDQ